VSIVLDGVEHDSGQSWRSGDSSLDKLNLNLRQAGELGWQSSKAEVERNLEKLGVEDELLDDSVASASGSTCKLNGGAVVKLSVWRFCMTQAGEIYLSGTLTALCSLLTTTA
jgi:hypothetical protein